MPTRPARKKRSSQNSGRKSKNKKTKTITAMKKALTVVALFFVSSVFLSGYLFYKKLTQEFASAFSVPSHDLLSQDVVTVAFMAVDDFEAEPVLVRDASLYVFDKSTLKLIIYHVPVTTVIDVPGKFSEEPFSNILALGLLEGEDLDQSSELFSRAIFKMLAFPVDRYVLVESGGEDFVKELLKGNIALFDTSELLSIKDMTKTNLELSELFKIYSFAKSLPEDRIWQKEIASSYLENPSLIDEELKDLTFDSELSREKKNLAVLNGTLESGVANFGARVLKNLGGRVVAVGNTKQVYEESVIITDDPISESTRMISQIFDIDKIILYSESMNISENEVSRSDVTVILGLDFAMSL